MRDDKRKLMIIMQCGQEFLIKHHIFTALLVMFMCLIYGSCAGEVVPAAKLTENTAAQDMNSPDKQDDVLEFRTLHETYEADNPEETMEFPEEREFDGWKGSLHKVEYEVIKQEPITRKCEDSLETELPWSETFPRAEATLEQDGITYHLKNIMIEEEALTGRKAEVEKQVMYRGYMETPDVAELHSTKYHDEKTGETVTALLPLRHIRKIYTVWRDDVSFTLRIDDVTADYYQLGEKLIIMEELPDAEEYPEVLKLLELDEESYRIESLWWADEEHKTIYGRGSRYASDYMAVYEGEAMLPDIDGFRGTAVYHAEWEEDTGESVYTIRASATYRQKESHINWVGTAGGTAAAGTGFVLVVLFFRRRKKKSQNIN